MAHVCSVSEINSEYICRNKMFEKAKNHFQKSVFTSSCWFTTPIRTSKPSFLDLISKIFLLGLVGEQNTRF